jgi:hypothetical protein
MKNYNQIVDEIEKGIFEGGQPVEMPVKHHFTPGMYCREIFIPAGTVLTSKIHKTEHPFVVSLGRINVIMEDNGVEEIVAPHFGITKPNTRRVLYAVEDTVWTTFHTTNVVPADNSKEEIEKAVSKIENKIIKKHKNKLLTSARKEILK